MAVRCLVLSSVNPHDICCMGIRAHPDSDLDRMLIERKETELAHLDRALERPSGVGDGEFWGYRCPPLPPNSEPQKDEPAALTAFIDRRPFRARRRTEWSERRWRLQRWAYGRPTGQVDSHVGRVLDALRDGPHAEHTLVVFAGRADGSAARYLYGRPGREAVHLEESCWKGERCQDAPTSC